METFCFVETGPYGSGKSVLALSYVPKSGKAKRIVLDKEVRSIRYQSEEHGETEDVPEKLLFSFDLYPDETGQVSAKQFVELIKKFEDEENEYNVLIIENQAMFQGDIEGWCQTASDAKVVLTALGLEKKYLNFLAYSFKPATPPWWNMVKDIAREFLLVAKRANMDIVITTEMRNEWENYGVRGTAPDGKPWARIKGKTAKLWNFVMQIADVCWMLDRNVEEITAKPTIKIDPLNPKLSIVGVPPTFKFTSWERIWEWEKARGVPDDEAFAEVEIDAVEYREGDPDNEDSGADPLELGKKKLIEDLEEYGYKDRAAVGAGLKKLGRDYTLGDHDTLFADLVALKEKEEEKE